MPCGESRIWKRMQLSMRGLGTHVCGSRGPRRYLGSARLYRAEFCRHTGKTITAKCVKTEISIKKYISVRDIIRPYYLKAD